MGLVWRCRDRELPLDERTLVMGIVNVTPDSFSDGGMFEDAEAAVRHGLRLLEEGADVLDVGGESTRPGSDPVDARRGAAARAPGAGRAPARSAGGRPVRGHAQSGRREDAVAAGADVVNDVSAGADPAMFGVVARSGAGPRPDAHAGRAQDDAGRSALRRRRRGGSGVPRGAARGGGRGRDRPRPPLRSTRASGSGRTSEHNLELLRSIGSFRELGVPVLVGVSRKRFVGELSGMDDPADRLEGSVAAAVWCATQGVEIVRVHDVAPTVRALRVVDAIARGGP